MLETLLLWLTVAFVVVAVVSVLAFFVARALFISTAEGVSRTIDRRVAASPPALSRTWLRTREPRESIWPRPTGASGSTSIGSRG